MNSTTGAPEVVDVNPYRSSIAGTGEHAHLGAILTCGQAYGHWSINIIDTRLDRPDWQHSRLQLERIPSSASQPDLTREDALDLAHQWVTGAISREDLRVAAEAAKQPR